MTLSTVTIALAIVYVDNSFTSNPSKKFFFYFSKSCVCRSLGLFACDVDQERAECRNCTTMKDHNILTCDQESQCQSKREEILSISKGARHAILDCQRRLNGSKWNCSTFDSVPIFGEFISKISVSDIFKLSRDCFNCLLFRVVHQRDCSPL